MNGRKAPTPVRGTAWLIALCLCLFTSGAVGDGLMPMKPAPPETPVYWQLVSVEQEPQVSPSGGYEVSYQVDGLSLDLSDGLMAESLVEKEAEAWAPMVTLTVSKGEAAMEHAYSWTALPIYLVPDSEYTIQVTGAEASQSANLNSLLGVYEQGALLSRVSAGSYTGHADMAAFVINASATSLYNDGSLIYSLILRDVNDMFRLRVVYTYRMQGGIKPEPTPIPGFVAVALDAALPEHYDPVPDTEALWRITTRPEEYRAYGSMNGSDPMFFPADAEGNVVMNEKPADPAADFDAYVKGFVPTEPQTAPEAYTEAEPGLFAFTARDGARLFRRYGRVDGGEAAYYPSNAEGVVEAETAEPVDPAADYTDYVQGFGKAQPDALPSHYQMVGPDVFAFTGRDGETRYRVYGRLDGAEPAYYPSDDAGALAEDAAAVNPADDFEQYVKGFDPTVPPSVPAFYSEVGEGVYAVDDREGNPVYRVHGIKDGAAPAFYPSDAAGEVVENAMAVTGDEDFVTYIVGFEPVTTPDAPFYYEETETPGVWTFEDLASQRQYRTYGILNRGEESFYPSDADGNVEHDALPVQPASDLANMPPPKFVKAEPETVPAHYTPVDGNVYTFEDREGLPVYRTYGAYGRAMPRFYPADGEGNPIENAEPVSPEQDFATFFEGFEPIATPEAPTYYRPVEGKEGVYAIETREGDALYRAYGARNRTEPAYYPSDAEGSLISDVPVNPADDIPLLPTPLTGAVRPEAVAQAPETTPLARVYEKGTLWPEATTQTNAVVTPAAEQVPETTPVTGHLTQPTPQTNTVATPAAEKTPETTPVTGQLTQPTPQTNTVATPGTDQQPETTPVTSGLEGETMQPDATGLTGGVNPAQSPTGAQTGVGGQLPPETPGPTSSSAVVAQPDTMDGGQPVVTGSVSAEPANDPVATLTEIPEETVAPVREESEGGIGGWIALAVGGVIAVGGGGFFLLRRKK